MPNRLAHELSPYLLQHAENPVDWYPWGPAAIDRARQENRPIFLSIGYSACHWCHVMEHECFENPTLATKLNESFVCIKVDREERPDLDQVYMNAIQLMIPGRGGWPMSVFLTPDLQPFYGGTYWPPAARDGMPGFGEVLDAVMDAWTNRREVAITQAAKVTDHLQTVGHMKSSSNAPLESLLASALPQLEQAFDFTHGGFGSAPKFPHVMDLRLLMQMWSRDRRAGILEMVFRNLDKMAKGGIYDHLGGGFARYSVDERWLVPHFEKMLYDNALLAGLYLDAYLLSANEQYARVARETCDYVLNYMTDPQGGFHSTEDADSEGEEGKFYLWTPGQIEEVLGSRRAERFCYVYDVSSEGNFEGGRSILNLPKSVNQCAALRDWDAATLADELAESRRELLAARDARVRPGKDDKVLVSWNALMIDTLARASGVLGEPKYLQAARDAADFLLTEMRAPADRLYHSWRGGQARHPAYLDDYAYLIQSLHSLYEAEFEERWIDEAVRLADLLLTHFFDADAGGFYFTSDDHEKLIARNKDLHDSSVPSGNGLAAAALWRLGKLCGRRDYLDASRRTIEFARGVMEAAPMAAAQLLLAADLQIGPLPEIVVLASTDQLQAAVAPLKKRFVPRHVVSARSTAEAGSEHLHRLYSGKHPAAGAPTVYVCQDYTCTAPVTGWEAVATLWDELSLRE